jgi:hypothetical protein
MRDLGVKTKRPIPAMLVDGGLISATTEEFIEVHLED